ncbi:MAG TPA: SBBP repeat-containing protein [Tepidisphaeraceae bacterium]
MSGHRARVESLESRMLLAADLSFAYQIGSPPAGTAANNDLGNAVAVDRWGNFYVAGGFAGTVDFNPSRRKTFNLTSTALTDAFVAKYAPDGSLLWARQAGGFGEDQATSVVVDRSGNVYVGGAFASDADFRPGKKLAILTSVGGLDAFLWKLDADGNLVSAVHGGGPSDDAVQSLALDANGDIIMSGFYRTEAQFNTSDLISAGGQDAFVVSVSPRLKINFAASIGGAEDDTGAGVAVDAAGNVYQTGTFAGTADLDPSDDASSDFSSQGADDAYVVKLTSRGAFVFARQMGGGGEDQGINVAVDRFGNILLTGPFAATADFDPGAGVTNLTSAGSSDVYVARLNPAGNLTWAKQAGGAGAEGVRGLTVDKAGNAYVAGQFTGTVDFDPGAGVSNLAGTTSTTNGFVWKLTASGTLAYARMLKTSSGGFCDGAAIALNAVGDLFVTGKFAGTVDFDPGTGVSNRATGGNQTYDAYLEKLLA